MNALELMKEAARTYEERSKIYKSSYIKNGKVLEALFPDGFPQVKTEDDHNRMVLFCMLITKLVRYANNYSEPHIDSIHDLGVYCFMQEELDRTWHKKRDAEEAKIYKGSQQ